MEGIGGMDRDGTSDVIYPMVNEHKYGKSSFYSWVNQLLMAMFHDIVWLPEDEGEHE